MGTTANYSWPTPVATDLVKDGWEAIKDLGDAADTTVKAVSDAQGLVHINTTSFSGVAAVNFNNVFSSTYDNYKILINAVATNNVTGHLIRFRLSGTDDSNALYQRQNLAVDGTGVTAARTTNQTSAFFGDLIGTDRDFIVVEVSAPNLARNTAYYLEQIRRYGTTSASSVKLVGGHTSTTQFDGFSYIITGSGITMSGEASVYGYRKS